ncbi:hypothetical protein TNCV_4961001 [Trichonephila clavipes]|uniref:Uncharacterized protein n=1 Tax=Trichonephila clavipes TaxID=2585209 RepID=A0A8X6VNT9_TRICX|nr:hypothetical protein TNCV_4961001 [Trichonephila clavipes]
MAVMNYQIKPLDSTNYSTSSTDVRFLLHEKNRYEIVAGEKSAPEIKENQRELKDFNVHQRLALSILYLNISTEYRSIIAKRNRHCRIMETVEGQLPTG